MNTKVRPVLKGSKLLPVRCWYCNRFISNKMDKVLGQQDIPGDYCCRGFYTTTRMAISE